MKLTIVDILNFKLEMIEEEINQVIAIKYSTVSLLKRNDQGDSYNIPLKIKENQIFDICSVGYDPYFSYIEFYSKDHKEYIVIGVRENEVNKNFKFLTKSVSNMLEFKKSCIS